MQWGRRLWLSTREKVIHIRYAEEMGLGTLDLSEIQVVGASIDEVRIPCNPLERQKETMLP